MGQDPYAAPSHEERPFVSARLREADSTTAGWVPMACLTGSLLGCSRSLELWLQLQILALYRDLRQRSVEPVRQPPVQVAEQLHRGRHQ